MSKFGSKYVHKGCNFSLASLFFPRYRKKYSVDSVKEVVSMCLINIQKSASKSMQLTDVFSD